MIAFSGNCALFLRRCRFSIGLVGPNLHCLALRAIRNFFCSLRKTVEKVKRVGLVANPDKIAARLLIRRVARAIERQGRAVLADRGTARLADLSVSSFPDIATLAREVDL